MTPDTPAMPLLPPSPQSTKLSCSDAPSDHRPRRPRPSPSPPPPAPPQEPHRRAHPSSKVKPKHKHKHTASPQLTAWAYQLSNEHLTIHERLERFHWEAEGARPYRRSRAVRWGRVVNELASGGLLMTKVKGEVNGKEIGVGKGQKMKKQVQLGRWACQVDDEEVAVGERMEEKK